ncbi:hypothetical protein IC762_03150 [Bradyrhizobium genosp. L]|uniref:alpha/beta fold hydrolase n=1 Tax=Bradyrhizobium genosp. L TaxID=83637 RepID=UPI0018A336CB|nr:hypothetical protein [Bradyrhizobium genosp. L]QPF85346.1 hypothetical protein IC762_03150 [Bradyrhizobium genosp. L]
MSRLIQIADWTGEKRANVVFVHGLGGHPYDTWRRSPTGDTFWPLWLAEDVKGLSVFSFGYISPATNWLGTAMPLLDEAANALRVLLNDTRLHDGPIVFVCHSLGGLIVKQVLRAANEQRSDPQTAEFLARVRQVVFVATPHTGSGKATLLERLGFWTWGSDSARDLVANKPELRDLNFGYRILARERKDQLRHLSYYEMVNTLFGRIVEPDSADPGLPDCTPTPIREDHITIAKPRRRDELVYAETRNFIAKLAPEPGGAAVLRTYPLEPFTVEWSWSQFVPKLIRIGAIGLVAVAIWFAVPRLHAVYSAIFSTQAQVSKTQSKIEQLHSDVVRIVSEKEGVPLDMLRAVVEEMGAAATTKDPGEIGRLLMQKADEFKALTERLNRLSDSDPEVKNLRLAAAAALTEGRFADANSYFASAQSRDLAGVADIEAMARKKRLSAAESTAQWASAAMLRPNPGAYREAAQHYAEAARIAIPADPKVARNYQRQQGNALSALGGEFGQNEALHEAIDDFRGLLGTIDRTSDRLGWARAKNDLGFALWKLGGREPGVGTLNEAERTYREALEELTPEHEPADWADVHNNLGLVLFAIGEREAAADKLKDAVVNFRQALEVRSREKTPVAWAQTQSNLGMALLRLGQRQSGTETLEQSKAAFEEALKVRTREKSPFDWAETQNSLGFSLTEIGQRQNSNEKLEQAVGIFREVLKEKSRQRFPLDWAMAETNLAIALVGLGLQEGQPQKFEEATALLREALEERREDRVPLDWAATQVVLGGTLAQIGHRDRSTEKLNEAIACYREALKEYTPERHAPNWAATEVSLGITLISLGELSGDVEKFQDAVVALKAGLQQYTPERFPVQWAATQVSIGYALCRKGKQGGETQNLVDGVAALREVMKAQIFDQASAQFEMVRNEIASCAPPGSQ